MYLDMPALVAEMRAAGLTVKYSDGYTPDGHGPLLRVNGQIIHHTAGPASGVHPSLGVVEKGRQGANPLKGPLANFLPDRDGVIWVITGGLAWHAGVAIPGFTNSYTIGWENEADGIHSFTSKQYNALRIGVAVVRKHYGHPVKNIRGHREVALPKGRKPDPKPFSMTVFRLKVATLPIPKATAIKPVVKPVKANPVHETHTGDAAKVEALQQHYNRLYPHFKLTEDGVWGPKTDLKLMQMRREASRVSALDPVQRGITHHQITAWVLSVQKDLGLKPLKVAAWGPKTDAAFMALRKRTLL